MHIHIRCGWLAAALAGHHSHHSMPIGRRAFWPQVAVWPSKGAGTVLSQPFGVVSLELGHCRVLLHSKLRVGRIPPPHELLLARVWLLLLLLMLLLVGCMLLLQQTLLLLALCALSRCIPPLRLRLRGGALGGVLRRFARVRHVRAKLWHASRGLGSRRRSSRAVFGR